MERDFQRRPVLYVEDHPVNALLMRALFEHRPGLKLVVATCGEQAMRLIPGLQPVLLLLDLRLPDCHGMQLLPLLKLHAGDVPAVAVTADDDFDITNSGFVELWSKPLNLDRVLERVDALASLPAVLQPPGAALHAPLLAMQPDRGRLSAGWR